MHFAELLVQYDLKDWYNAKQIEDIYGMKRAALNKYALRHNVPRILFQNVTYFSKSHIDNLKRLAKIPDGNYYTVQDIVKSSSFSTSQVRYYVKNEELKVKRVNGLSRKINLFQSLKYVGETTAVYRRNSAVILQKNLSNKYNQQSLGISSTV